MAPPISFEQYLTATNSLAAARAFQDKIVKASAIKALPANARRISIVGPGGVTINITPATPGIVDAMLDLIIDQYSKEIADIEHEKQG